MEILIGAAVVIFIFYNIFGIRKVNKLNNDQMQHLISELLVLMAERKQNNMTDEFDIVRKDVVDLLKSYSGEEARTRLAHAWTLVKYKTTSKATQNTADEVCRYIGSNITW